MILAEMRKKRGEAVDAARALHEKAKAENRDFTAEEQTQYDAKMAEAKALKGQIEREEILEAEGRSLNAADPIIGSDNRGATGTGVQVGADNEADRPFATFGEQLRAVYLAATQPHLPVDKRLLALNEISKRAAPLGANEGIASEGGFAVQVDHAGMLIDTAVTTGAILSRVDTYPVSAASNAAKWMDIAETDVSTTVFGGVQVYWAGEAQTVTASKPALRERELALLKLFGLAYATDELMQDAPFVDALFTRAFSTAIERKLEGDIVAGTGAGCPLGILSSGSLVSITKETGQATATVVYENISKMWNRALPDRRSSMVWLVHPDVEQQLDFLSFPVGTGGVPVYLPAGGASVDGYSALKGRPVIPTDHCAALGTVGDIVLADLSDYILIRKGGVQADTSMHVQFLTAQQAFRFIFRCNGMPKHNTALTIKNSSNTRSWFVATATRA